MCEGAAGPHVMERPRFRGRVTVRGRVRHDEGEGRDMIGRGLGSEVRAAFSGDLCWVLEEAPEPPGRV